MSDESGGERPRSLGADRTLPVHVEFVRKAEGEVKVSENVYASEIRIDCDLAMVTIRHSTGRLDIFPFESISFFEIKVR